MMKTIFVQAHFKPIFKEVAQKVDTGETKKSWLGYEKKVYTTTYSTEIVGYSDTEIDGARLSEDIDKAVNEWLEKGYRVVCITPVISGAYNYQYDNSKITSSPRFLSDTEKVSGGGSYGFGYGYSYTEGVIIFLEEVK